MPLFNRVQITPAEECDMKRNLLVSSVITLGWVALTHNLATAQQPYSRPPTGPNSNRSPLSPYLFLNSGGNSPVVNYYSLVRPQIDLNRNLNNVRTLQASQQSQIDSAQQTLQDPNNQVSSTGHPSFFLNYQKYFLNTGANAIPRGTTAGAGSGFYTAPNSGATGNLRPIRTQNRARLQ